MKIIYLDHAKENLAERKISKHLIKEAIHHPDEILESKKGRKIAHKLIGKKLLRVIYKHHPKAFIVITAYYTNPTRYMKQ